MDGVISLVGDDAASIVVDANAVEDIIVIIEDVLVAAGDDKGVEDIAGRSDGVGSRRVTVTACDGGPVPTCV